MPHYVKIGKLPRHRHTYEDRIYYEEVIGAESFEGPYSIVYHRNPPTSIQKFQTFKKKTEFEEGFIDEHCHIITDSVKKSNDFFSGRSYLFGNDFISVGVSKFSGKPATMEKMALMDLIIFVHEGDGLLETILGEINYDKYDYIVIPKGIPFRFISKKKNTFFFMESLENVKLPQRYLNSQGQLKLQSPLSDRNIRVPDLSYEKDNILDIEVDDGPKITKVTLDHDPRDVIGWDGTLYPFAINAMDQMPWVGKIHLPPPVHQTFEGKHYMVATFLPRPFDFHERSIPISFYHSNTDVDEVLFYSSGNFMSRKGIRKGSITIHVRNFSHGPHPGKYEDSIGKKGTDEIAVMIETYDRIRLYKGAKNFLDENYKLSWSEK